jgi:hypothetical protein
MSDRHERRVLGPVTFPFLINTSSLTRDSEECRPGGLGSVS